MSVCLKAKFNNPSHRDLDTDAFKLRTILCRVPNLLIQSFYNVVAFLCFRLAKTSGFSRE